MEKPQSKIGSVVRISIGNFLEMYDFMVFGYYAAEIGRAFFPGSSQFLSLMLSLTTFGAGFLMRPLGAMVLGNYVDRYGRRKGMILVLALMAVGTMTVACTPGYASIGILAPLLVVAGRLVQGFSAGVEVGGASVYLAEISTPGRIGFYTSWQSGSQQVAVMIAALTGLAVNSQLSPAQMERWGWRIPLLIGCLLIPFVLWLRRSLAETQSWISRKRRPSTSEVWHTVFTNWRLVILGMLMSTLTTVTFYMITAYTPTFGRNVLHLATVGNLIVTLCAGASNFLLLPVMGAVSDKAGRRPQMIVSAILALVTAAPLYLWLAGSPSFARLLTVELWFSIIFASYNGAAMAFLTEVMPAHVRATGFSLAFSLATAIFGGFTPAVSTALVRLTGSRAAPALWLSVAAICALFATAMLSPARRARELERIADESGGTVDSMHEFSVSHSQK